MAAAASKVSSTTVLRIGKVEVPIGLFSTAAKPGATPQGFTTAGPNGGVLKARAVARPVPVDVPADEDAPEHSDPLATLSEAGESATVPSLMEQAGWLTWERDPEVTGAGDAETQAKRAELAERLAAQRVADAPDGRAAAREALAAEAEGDARSRGFGSSPGGMTVPPPIEQSSGWSLQGQGPLGEITRAQFEEAQRDPKVRELLRKADEVEVDGAYARELVEDGSGVVVKPEDVRRGVRLEDGRFVDCTSQLEQIEERTRLETADVVAFVDATTIPRMRVKGAYYIGTDDPVAPRALRIVHDGLARSRRAAVVKLCKRSRQTLGVVVPARDALVLLELVWSEDYRAAPARALRHCDVPVSEREVGAFCDLIEAMSEPPRVIDRLRDDAIALREELFARAVAGDVPDVLVPQATEPQRDELLAQLEASLAEA